MPEPKALTPPETSGVSRRTLIEGAAWSLPVIAVAVASPAASASGDIGAYSLNGTCGVLGVLGPGFTLTASATAPIPAGTTIAITGSGVANIGVFSITGGTATVTVISPTSRLITTTADIPAGSTMAMRTTLSITVAFTLSGSTTLPEGWTGTDGKPNGTVTSSLVLCSAT